MSDVQTCRYCLGTMPLAARKCKDCLEFVEAHDSKAERSSTWLKIYQSSINGLAKAALPLALVAILISFHSEISALLIRARSAQFAGVDIVFDVPGVSNGTVTLHPISLYYLLGAAKKKGAGSWVWDKMPPQEQSQILVLQTKGLADTSVVPCRPDHKCVKEVEIRPTADGYKFIRSIGLQEITASPPAP